MSLGSRREKLRDLMDRLGLGALLMRQPADFAWYTGGADNRVDHADPLGVAGILLTSEAEYVLTDNIEAPRMRGEEIPPLRYVFDPEAIERYRRLGADAADAVTEAAASVRPDTDEREAANLEAACRRRGMFAPVLLAASERRMGLYRHPIPRGGALGRRAMLVVCAERGGLYANLTRIVDFEDPDPETARRQRACDAVLRRMREEATLPGRTLAEALAGCRRFYAEEGFPDGWRDHHQGGTTGYASREVVATPETRQMIEAGQAFTWNPSLRGAKAEEPFILTEVGAEVITGS